ncbi:MAG: hypothetical protein EPN74_11515 [Rhodanobacter sp.]|nr:MAG: hypothetical protein EPN74_11515 [Rhodanobacter sp.]
MRRSQAKLPLSTVIVQLPDRIGESRTSAQQVAVVGLCRRRRRSDHPGSDATTRRVVAHRHSLPAATPQLEGVAGELPTPVPSEWGIALAELIANSASATLTVIMASQRHQLAAERCIIERNELRESSERDKFAWCWSIEPSDRDVRQLQSLASKSDTKSCHRCRYVTCITKKA